jgi:hypothetical protein
LSDCHENLSKRNETLTLRIHTTTKPYGAPLKENLMIEVNETATTGIKKLLCYTPHAIPVPYPSLGKTKKKVETYLGFSAFDQENL